MATCPTAPTTPVGGPAILGTITKPLVAVVASALPVPIRVLPPDGLRSSRLIVLLHVRLTLTPWQFVPSRVCGFGYVPVPLGAASGKITVNPPVACVPPDPPTVVTR